MAKLRKQPENILQREAAFELLSPFFDDYFLPAIQAGLNAFAGLTPLQRQPLTARTKSNMLNDYVVDDLAARLKGEAGVKINDDCGFTMFIFSGKAAVRVKKVDRSKNHSNISTKQQQNLDGQVELPGMPNGATYVTLGYYLDALWDKAIWVQAICRKYGRVQWALPVASDPLQAVLFTEKKSDAHEQRKARVRAKGAGKAEA